MVMSRVASAAIAERPPCRRLLRRYSGRARRRSAPWSPAGNTPRGVHGGHRQVARGV